MSYYILWKIDKGIFVKQYLKRCPELLDHYTLYCYMKGKHIMVLHAFVKKSGKTPKPDLDIALKRKREVDQR